MKRQFAVSVVVVSMWLLGLSAVCAQQTPPPTAPPMNSKIMEYIRNTQPQPQLSIPLYGDGAIPNSKPTPNEEVLRPMGQMANVSRPTLEVFLPAKVKAN